jgi:glutaredoxin
MNGPVTRVTLLTQDDCTFCDHAKQVLARVGNDYPLQVDEVGLATPAGQALAVREGVLFAPGVLLDDALFSHGRLSEKNLRRTLERRLGAPASDRSTR